MKRISLFSNRLIRIVMLLFSVAAMVLGFWSCSPQSYSGTTESITLADLALASSALIYIAEHQIYFSKKH